MSQICVNFLDVSLISRLIVLLASITSFLYPQPPYSIMSDIISLLLLILNVSFNICVTTFVSTHLLVIK